MDFGREVLSHPLLAEAVETEFVPVAIHNNKKGKDAEVLARFKEPSWNNPVVRYLDANAKDVIPRRDRVWTLGGTAARMVQALEKQQRSVPGYLKLLAAEGTRKGRQRVTFAMHCFWEGEAALGGLEGVLATRVGWLEGKEVVEVEFDGERLAFGDLVGKAKKLRCTNRVFVTDRDQLKEAERIVGKAAVLNTERARDAKASDRLRRLRASRQRWLPLTPLQAIRVNAALAQGRDPAPFLSPRQRTLTAQLQRTAPSRLKGLQPPADGKGLAAYAQRLRTALREAAKAGK